MRRGQTAGASGTRGALFYISVLESYRTSVRLCVDVVPTLRRESCVGLQNSVQKLPVWRLGNRARRGLGNRQVVNTTFWW